MSEMSKEEIAAMELKDRGTVEMAARGAWLIYRDEGDKSAIIRWFAYCEWLLLNGETS